MAKSRKAQQLLAPDIEEKLLSVFQGNASDSEKIARRVEDLSRRHGEAVYASLLFLLAHLDFTPRSARQQWERLLKHHEQMSEELDRDVDLRVALLDYFIARNRKLRHPKILELRLYKLAQKEALSDELTGLANYRHFQDSLETELKRAVRAENHLSVALFDVDDFKIYNDQNGHLAGNQVLRRIARLLAKTVRETDTVARYGGEEFALLLPDTTKQGALVMADRIRSAVERAKFPFASKQPRRKITLSGGIASYPADGKTTSEIVEKADIALYRAKSDGKNQIKVFLSETRSFARVDQELVGSFNVIPNERIDIETRNLSKSGLLFHSSTELPIGATLEMSIRVPRAKAVRLKAQVVRVERLTRRRFDIGVTIIRMPAADRKRFEAHIDELLAIG